MTNQNLTKLCHYLILSGLLLFGNSCKKDLTISLNESEFRDKIYACWLGKNIGGTLGMPFEGDTSIHNATFYTKLKDGEPAANDDLDLQILWLKAMQENDAHVDAFKLGKYWLKYIPVNWNEYGVGKANMRAGFMPPVSGEFNNAKWKHSNGAWIRSEIWACLFPGNPYMAAKMAREDACVDHGMAEGTFAEIFTASIESAAFFESDRDSLIHFGLSMIPSGCRVAQSVKCALEARENGKTWQEARLSVIRNTEDMGWFQAPRNVAFTIIGWLYGENDFGKSICIAVNCGDDTDCTGATLASIFGIIGGTKAIPEAWRKPVGDKITNVAIAGFKAPGTLDELTDSTLAMTKKVAARFKLPVVLNSKRTTDYTLKQMAPGKDVLEKLWKLSPWRVVRHNEDWVIMFDYLDEPYILDNIPRKLAVYLSNVSGRKESYKLEITGLSEKWQVTGLPADTFGVEKEGKRNFEFSIVGNSSLADTTRMNLILSRGIDTDTVPFTLLRKKN